MKAEMTRDQADPSVYRVEAIDADGGCEVAIFSGPRAFERATSFGATHYEDGCDCSAILEN